MLANLLDVIIMGVPVYLLVSLVFGFDLESAAENRFLVSPADMLNIILLVGVTVLLWVHWDGRTPGKKMLAIRIVSYPDYRPFSYGTAVPRTIASLVSLLVFGLGYIVIAVMVAWRADRRGYHDILARTCVIHDETKPAASR